MCNFNIERAYMPDAKKKIHDDFISFQKTKNDKTIFLPTDLLNGQSEILNQELENIATMHCQLSYKTLFYKWRKQKKIKVESPKKITKK